MVILQYVFCICWVKFPMSSLHQHGGSDYGTWSEDRRRAVGYSCISSVYPMILTIFAAEKSEISLCLLVTSRFSKPFQSDDFPRICCSENGGNPPYFVGVSSTNFLAQSGNTSSWLIITYCWLYPTTVDPYIVMFCYVCWLSFSLWTARCLP